MVITQLRQASLAESVRHALRQFFEPQATFVALHAAHALDRPTVCSKHGAVQPATSGSNAHEIEQSVACPSNAALSMIA